MKRSDQETLTRVGPGTPMGDLLRRYWFPVAGSVELAPGAKRSVRLLGQSFVLFRTTEGVVGLVDERCPHRGTTLAMGTVDASGIRCAYHGWKFATDGVCLETPNVHGSSRLRVRARAGCYEVDELGGLIFVYVGPSPAPRLPRYDLLVWPDALRDIGRAVVPCNWLQIMENSVDPTHVEWLHGHHLAKARAALGLSTPTHYRRRHDRIAFDRFELGILKRRLLEGGSESDDDWAIGHPLIFPNLLRVGASGQDRLQIRVPVDDDHTLHFWYACYRPNAPVRPQAEVPVYEVPFMDDSGAPILDFVDGGDIHAWIGQGPIADRTREILTDADQGIIELRKLLFEQLAVLAEGRDPMGVIRSADKNRIIELPQERDKYGAGLEFLRETLALSHARYSPLFEEIVSLFEV